MWYIRFHSQIFDDLLNVAFLSMNQNLVVEKWPDIVTCYTKKSLEQIADDEQVSRPRNQVCVR